MSSGTTEDAGGSGFSACPACPAVSYTHPFPVLTACLRTHPGAVRANNEDVALCDADLGLLALADGMGGHNAGEIAARLAVEALLEFLRGSVGGMPAQWPVGFDAARSLTTNRLRTAMTLANRQVFRTSDERPECEGMGTTLTAVLVEGRHITYTSVGDSRLYRFHQSQLQQLTRDDSVIGAVADSAGIDPALFGRHPLRHLLTKVLGRRDDVDAPVEELELADGDLLLLSSDGMHGALPHDSIRAILTGQSSLDRAADLLVRTALETDGRDNITVILARCSGQD